MKKQKYLSLDTVSSGTMREQDLIPEFLGLAETITMRRNDRNYVNEIRGRALYSEGGYYDSDRSRDDLEALFGILDNYCPPYGSFGLMRGDGAYYGVWIDHRSVKDDISDGALLSVEDVEARHEATGMRYTGLAIDVNDHGNMTLFQYIKGHRRAIWSVV